MRVSVSWFRALAALVALMAGGFTGSSAFAALSVNPKAANAKRRARVVKDIRAGKTLVLEYWAKNADYRSREV